MIIFSHVDFALNYTITDTERVIDDLKENIDCEQSLEWDIGMIPTFEIFRRCKNCANFHSSYSDSISYLYLALMTQVMAQTLSLQEVDREENLKHHNF